MSTSSVDQHVEYPTGDGKPMAETPLHRDNMLTTIERFREWYRGRNDVYVSGNMMMYYVEGNGRKHVSPDVFVVLDIPNAYRDAYFTWMEPKRTLDLVIEFTSKSTSAEDVHDKMELYASELGVREYLLFDPYAEYLDPPEQLFRLVRGRYRPIDAVDGRLPSKVTDLHFERDGVNLALWNPATGSYVPTPEEREAAEKLAERARADREEAEKLAERARADQERFRADQAEAEVLAEQRRAEAALQEVERLKAELDAFRRKP